MNYKEQYVEAYRKYIRRDGAASLLNWLMTTDFFEAPASTKYHGNFPGGLALHSLNVFERMRNNCVYEFGAECGGAEPFPEEALEPIAIVALLHDICKAEFYKQDFRNQKIYSEHGTQFDKRGAYCWESVPFYTVEEKFPFGHGEKSVFLINEHMHLKQAAETAFHGLVPPRSGNSNTEELLNPYPVPKDLFCLTKMLLLSKKAQEECIRLSLRLIGLMRAGWSP